ncbi:MAG: hypothetical protein NC124_05670 [Clostridium sp.]|nr:hypothetical protein [Clostridium sp.]
MCKAMEDLRNEGRAEGRAEGKAEGMIKAYADMGIPISDIAKKVSLTENEVEKIIQQLEEETE